MAIKTRVEKLERKSGGSYMTHEDWVHYFGTGVWPKGKEVPQSEIEFFSSTPPDVVGSLKPNASTREVEQWVCACRAVMGHSGTPPLLKEWFAVHPTVVDGRSSLRL